MAGRSERSQEEVRLAAQALVNASDNRALRSWFLTHWWAVGDERIRAVLDEIGGVAKEPLQELVARARLRGLSKTVLELVPLAPQLMSAAEQYVAAHDWPERLHLLRQNASLLTSIDAEAYMASRSEQPDPGLADAIRLAAVTREKGIAFARGWSIAQLEQRSHATIPALALDALRQLVLIPLTERTWDPLPENLWAEELRRYRRASEVWKDVDQVLRFFIQLLPLSQWSRTAWIDVSLEIAWLYLVRPPGPDSDRAHNIELALSYEIPALNAIDREDPPARRVRAHELLGRTYLVRFQQDPRQALESARRHFTEALDGCDVASMSAARAEVGQLIGWSMIELVRNTLDPADRRKVIAYTVDTLREQHRGEADIYLEVELAEALALSGEFDRSDLRQATALIEGTLARTAADRPPAVRLVPASQHEANVRAVHRWAYCRYVYAEIAARRRALEVEFNLSRAIQEITDAEAYLFDWGLTGERLSGSELLGDLLMYEAKWQEALDAYKRVGQTPSTLAPASYHPFTVYGREAVTTAASRVDAKAAYCVTRLGGEPVSAVLLSDHSKTIAILDALRWEDLASRITEQGPRSEFLAALAQMRALEARSRLAIQAFGERPDTDTGWRLIEARKLLSNLAASQKASGDIDKFELSQNDVFAAVPSKGFLVVPLITHVGSAFVAIRRRDDGAPAANVTYTALTSEICRNLLGRYIHILERIASQRQEPDPVVLLNQLLIDLSGGLARDLRRAVAMGDTKTETPVRFVNQMGIGVLPLHAAHDEATKRTLHEDYVYSSIPSIGVIAYQMRRNPATSRRSETLVVTNPTGDLPYAPLEGHLVAAAISAGRARIIEGRKATKDQIMKMALTANLHFAGHAKADLSAPWKSFLATADGDLTAAEVAASGLAGPTLVTLSACESGFSDLTRAPNELGGLPCAFLMAGARSVVSSLWPMPDIPTTLLMGEFYRAMNEDSAIDIPQALRGAELWLRSADKATLNAWLISQERKIPLAGRRNWRIRWQLLRIRSTLRWWRGKEPPYGHPYYWAGFVPLTVHA